jgi:succinate-acetate transporter protein
VPEEDRAAFVTTEIHPRASAAEPAVVGLTGLAVAALVLASADLGLASATAKSLVIPWTLFLGATAQLIAGLVDFRRNNMFGATAFTTYSLLWYSVSLTLVITTFTGVEIDLKHYAFGLIGFFIFSLILTVGSAMTNKTLFGVLVFIDLSILSLALDILAGTPSEIVGAFLLCVAALSFYGAAGILINTMDGRTLVPLGGPLWRSERHSAGPDLPAGGSLEQEEED